MNEYRSDLIVREFVFEEDPDAKGTDMRVPRPQVFTLCGSSRFRQQHEEAQKNLTLKNIIVIPMGMYGHLEGLDMTGEIKKKLDRLHLHKIALSDGIFVVNPKIVRCKNCGVWWARVADSWKWPLCSCENGSTLGEEIAYVGESTRREIDYAMTHGKIIRWLNVPE